MSMHVLPASEPQFANCHLHRHDFFPAPQLTTMTIARSTNVSGFSQLPRVPTMRTTSTGSNPMMRVTLPKEIGDDPLASPIAFKPHPAFFQESEPEREPTPAPTAPSSSSSGFANVFTRRRQSSIEKKPPMPTTLPPSLRRTTSAPMKASLLVSKMAPMLKRVVSGSKSRSEADHDDEAEYPESRESLLMLMRVPDMHRQSQLPLMMGSNLDY